MLLTKEAIAEFKEIYEREFNETITDSEAEEMGLRVIRVFRLLRSPLHSESVTDTESGTSCIQDTPSSFTTTNPSTITQSSNTSKPLPPLTEKEQSALHFITAYQKLHHRLPSSRVLAKHLGYRSSKSGYTILKRLRNYGYV